MGYCIEKYAVTCFFIWKVRKGEKRCIKVVFKYVIIKSSELQVQNIEGADIWSIHLIQFFHPQHFLNIRM